MNIQQLKKKACEIYRELTRLVALALIIALLIASHWLAYGLGGRDVHNALTSDMRRYNEPGIMARNPSGAFYLYTYTLTYFEWLGLRFEK